MPTDKSDLYADVRDKPGQTLWLRADVWHRDVPAEAREAWVMNTKGGRPPLIHRGGEVRGLLYDGVDVLMRFRNRYYVIARSLLSEEPPAQPPPGEELSAKTADAKL